MAQENTSPRQHSNVYNILIFVLTIISLIIMVVMFLPLDEETIGLLRFYENPICVIFFVDFFLNLRAVSLKTIYFIKECGWFNLLGSIPSFVAVSRFSALLRLTRLSRLVHLSRLLTGQRKQKLIRDVLGNCSWYTTFITVFLTLIVLATASMLVLQFESEATEANITTGWDALRYSIVTITMVGFGDLYPVSFWGRIIAVFIMVAGVGLIGVMASLLPSLLIGDQSETEIETSSTSLAIAAFEMEVASINEKLDDLHRHYINKEGELIYIYRKVAGDAR